MTISLMMEDLENDPNLLEVNNFIPNFKTTICSIIRATLVQNNWLDIDRESPKNNMQVKICYNVDSLGSGFYSSYPSITQRGVYTIENIYDPFRQRIDQVPINNVFQRQSPTRLINNFDQMNMNMINPQQQITNNMGSTFIRNFPQQTTINTRNPS